MVATTDKLIVIPHNPWLLKSCKIVESEASVPSSSAAAVTATFLTTSTVDGGMYVSYVIVSPSEFVVVTVVVEPAKYNVIVVVDVV